MKIHISTFKNIICNFFLNSVLTVSCLLLNLNGFTQDVRNQHRIYFISDIQAPLPLEKMVLKAYKNEEARDILFADILLHNPGNLLMLGDLTSRGSNEKSWWPLDEFMNSLKAINTKVYAIPGNHEYMSRSSGGTEMFIQRFKKEWLSGYVVSIDSIAIVMLNSNVGNMADNELSEQLKWYKATMISLDSDPAINAIIVCTHHPPFSNSKIVGSSEPVQKLIIPEFEKSQKSKLFISGHSHNLEYFSNSFGRHFLVIGGGGSLTQPLVPRNKSKYHDLLEQDLKPIYFYLIIEKKDNKLKLIARGFKKDFVFFEYNFGFIPLK
ncbi:MAG: metallophosphoesterase [Bacteroidia bacterium]|nr:metallophosphoesterase [Bacteroidia bacterium]